MEERKKDSKAANIIAARYFASYAVSVVIFIASIVFLLNAAQGFGADRAFILKLNMATPVVALLVSIAVHFSVRHRISYALLIAVISFVLSFAAAVLSRVL